MKKFFRLIFLLSVVLIILYSFNFVRECNQIRRTFGAFLVLNDSGSGKQCQLVNETKENNYDVINLFDNPIPLWNKAGEVFVYSAFWNSVKEPHVIAIGIGPTVLQVSAYSCHVWFEFENLIISVPGTFTILISPHCTLEKKICIHSYMCNVQQQDIKGKPYMLVIIHAISKSDVKKTFVPIFSRDEPKYLNDKLAICVQPDRVGVGKNQIVEFVSFHQLVGLTDLIIYGNEINYSIINKLKQLTVLKSFLRSVSLIPWNFPYDDKSLELVLLETDCKLRTHGITQAFSLLEWDQYIMPNQAKTLLNILSINSPSTVNIQLKSEICCVEQKNDKRSETTWPIILQKTRCMELPFYNAFKMNGIHKLDSGEVNLKNYTSILSVKTYRSCYSLKDIKTQYDYSPFKFLSGLLASNLLRLWNSGSLF